VAVTGGFGISLCVVVGSFVGSFAVVPLTTADVAAAVVFPLVGAACMMVTTTKATMMLTTTLMAMVTRNACNLSGESFKKCCTV
jgi:hypothetical protein